MLWTDMHQNTEALGVVPDDNEKDDDIVSSTPKMME